MPVDGYFWRDCRVDPGGAGEGGAVAPGREGVDGEGAVMGGEIGHEPGDGRGQTEQDAVGLNVQDGVDGGNVGKRERVGRAGVDGREGEGFGFDTALDVMAGEGELGVSAEFAGDEIDVGEVETARDLGGLRDDGERAVAEPVPGAGKAELLEQARGVGMLDGQRAGPAMGGYVEDGMGLGPEVAEVERGADGEGFGRSGRGEDEVGGAP